jgi:hypothetical protein
VWVCTGDFSIGEAALVAASLGCDVEERITKKTTMLVVGQRDPARFKGKEKSRKQLQAEAAAAEGREIAIMTEREFLDFAERHRTGLVLSTASLAADHSASHLSTGLDLVAAEGRQHDAAAPGS